MSNEAKAREIWNALHTANLTTKDGTWLQCGFDDFCEAISAAPTAALRAGEFRGLTFEDDHFEDVRLSVGDNVYIMQVDQVVVMGRETFGAIARAVLPTGADK